MATAVTVTAVPTVVAKKTMTAAVATTTIASTCVATCATTTIACGCDTAAAPSATMTMEEVRGLGATAERHHQHNTVHDVHLLQKKGKPTHAL